MKKFLYGILTLCLLTVSSLNAFAQITDENYQSILDQVSKIEEAVNNGDTESILQIISPNASETLKTEIQNNIDGKTILYWQDITTVELLAPNKAKATGPMKAEGENWNIKGIESYFIFEKIDGNWLLLESDFQQKISANYVLGFIGKIALVAIPIFLLLFIFWIWMLVDAIKRPIPNKVMWVLIIIFLQLLGAILYYFIVRRKELKKSA